MGAANILWGKTAGQDYKNYILSLMFYKRLCDQWENEAEEAIAEQERLTRRPFTEQQKAVFRARGEHRFTIPEGARWGDILVVSENIGEADCLRGLLWRLQEAIWKAHDNGDALAGIMKASNAEQIVENLAAHFESMEKLGVERGNRLPARPAWRTGTLVNRTRAFCRQEVGRK